MLLAFLLLLQFLLLLLSLLMFAVVIVVVVIAVAVLVVVIVDFMWVITHATMAESRLLIYSTLDNTCRVPAF